MVLFKPSKIKHELLKVLLKLILQQRILKMKAMFLATGWIKIDMAVSECDSEIINEADKKPVDCDK